MDQSNKQRKMFLNLPIKTKRKFRNIFQYGLSFVILFASLFPLIWMLLSISKTSREVVNGNIFPTHLVFDGIRDLFDTIFFNSLLVTLLGAIISVSLAIIINTATAFAFARLDFYGKKILWIFVLLPLFVPGMTILIPLYLVVQRMGILNTMTVLIIPGVAQAIHIFFMRQFFLNIPRELDEAARIDGANTFQIFWHLYVPLSVGPVIIVGISAYLGFWNAYLWPALTIDNDSLKQVMQVVMSFRPSRNPNWPLVMSSSLFALLPPLVLYIIFSKHITENLKISGIK